MEKTQKFLPKGLWILGLLATFSCVIRNDYNVIFSFLLLIIYNAYYSSNEALFSKIIFQCLALLICIDILWLIVIIPFWSDDENASEFFKSLAFMHSVGIILGFVELALKGALAFVVFSDYNESYKEEGSIFSIDYITKNEAVPQNTQ